MSTPPCWTMLSRCCYSSSASGNRAAIRAMMHRLVKDVLSVKLIAFMQHCSLTLYFMLCLVMCIKYSKVLSDFKYMYFYFIFFPFFFFIGKR